MLGSPSDGFISIHAPRTGSDPAEGTNEAAEWHFNPRSPHGERRFHPRAAGIARRFQSTLPARGATCRCQSRFTLLLFQSTLPARGATANSRAQPGERRFQSTLPARGATFVLPRRSRQINISIHAPRTGSDPDARTLGRRERPFQSTLPARGATLTARRKRLSKSFQSTLPARGATHPARFFRHLDRFQSTLPARGATIALLCPVISRAISIHAPRTGSD